MARLGEFLLGRWQLSRSLEDLNSGAAGGLAGVVTFTPVIPGEDDGEAMVDHPASSLRGANGGVLRQREEGRLRWSAPDGTLYTGPAARSYFLLPTSEPDAMDVRFDDGRPFHRLDLGTGRWQTVHHCSADSYDLDFAVESADLLTYRWGVTGPAKNLCLRSILRRLP